MGLPNPDSDSKTPFRYKSISILFIIFMKPLITNISKSPLYERVFNLGYIGVKSRKDKLFD